MPEAVALNPLLFQRRTVEAYSQIPRLLEGRRACHPIRFWNYIPQIEQRVGDRMDRYMVFNAGRYAAYVDWHGSEDVFDQCVASATGIGHMGRDLVIHALAADRAGVHLKNPRQRQPSAYSRGHGPLPPCFARATVIQQGHPPVPVVLAAGTASICGQESLHAENLPAQVHETFDNLANLVRAATDACAPVDTNPISDVAVLLQQYRSLRVYYRNKEHIDQLKTLVQTYVPQVDRIEFFQAEICRPELLVEIEGTADVLS